MGTKASSHNTIEIRGGEHPPVTKLSADVYDLQDYCCRTSGSLRDSPFYVLASRPVYFALIWFRYPAVHPSREFARVGVSRCSFPTKRKEMTASFFANWIVAPFVSRRLETKLSPLSCNSVLLFCRSWCRYSQNTLNFNCMFKVIHI